MNTAEKPKIVKISTPKALQSLFFQLVSITMQPFHPNISIDVAGVKETVPSTISLSPWFLRFCHKVDDICYTATRVNVRDTKPQESFQIEQNIESPSELCRCLTFMLKSSIQYHSGITVIIGETMGIVDKSVLISEPKDFLFDFCTVFGNERTKRSNSIVCSNRLSLLLAMSDSEVGRNTTNKYKRLFEELLDYHDKYNPDLAEYVLETFRQYGYIPKLNALNCDLNQRYIQSILYYIDRTEPIDTDLRKKIDEHIMTL